MQGTRRTIAGADGVPLGLLCAGAGSPLLLIHGGVGQIERWVPVWDRFGERWNVIAMDRRGRGSSGDGAEYDIRQEYDDIAAVVTVLAEEANRPVDVFAHSYGATCALGAANRGGAIRQMVLYEPPGPETVPPEWVERVSALVAEGRTGAAMVSFLSDIIDLKAEEIEVLKKAPPLYDIFSVLVATLEREARALTSVDLLHEARTLPCPITLLLGAKSPAWARNITDAIAAVAPVADVVVLPGVGHEAIDTAPDVILGQLRCALDVAPALRSHTDPPSARPTPGP